MGCWDPDQKKCYLPYADTRYYWKEACKWGRLKGYKFDWTKTESSFRKCWTGEGSKFKDWLKVLQNKPASSASS